MKLQSEKMAMIHQIIAIEDEKTLTQIKSLLDQSSKNAVYEMGFDEFLIKIEESENDFLNGKVLTTAELKNQIATWKKK